MTFEEKQAIITYYEEKEKEFKQSEKLLNSYKKLLKDKDFKAVIIDGYLREEAIRLTENQKMFIKKATPQTIEWAKTQDNIIQESLLAVSYFREFLDSIVFRHETIKQELTRAKEVYDTAVLEEITE